MKNIIMQLIAMQSYTNLKLVFLLNDKTSLDFQFAKMLPHVWDDRHEIRFFGDNEKDIKDISDYLGKKIRMMDVSLVKEQAKTIIKDLKHISLLLQMIIEI